jgi:hypothetical protein
MLAWGPQLPPSWITIRARHWPAGCSSGRPRLRRSLVCWRAQCRRSVGHPSTRSRIKEWQFQEEYLDWCRRRGVKPRFGAVGESGSIAVVERFMRTLKHECCARILVPFGLEAMRREAELFCGWYDGERPHQGLGGATPDERYHGRRPAHEGPRIEPTARYPVESDETATGPPKRVKLLELVVSYQEGRRHLPLVELKQAA